MTNVSRISPPPMRRQRTATETLRDTSRLPILTDSSSLFTERADDGIKRTRPYQHDTLRSFPAGGLGAHSSSSDLSRHSLSSSDHPHLLENKSRNDSSNSRKSSVSLHSDGVLRSSRKPVCLMCSKSTDAKYDRMIDCPGCHRHYHDSCRTPPLIDGVNP